MKMFDALHAEFEAAGYSIRSVSAQEGFAEKLATHKDGPIVLGYPVLEDTTFALCDELIAKGVLLEKTTAKPVLGEYFDKIPGMTVRRIIQHMLPAWLLGCLAAWLLGCLPACLPEVWRLACTGSQPRAASDGDSGQQRECHVQMGGHASRAS